VICSEYKKPTPDYDKNSPFSAHIFVIPNIAWPDFLCFRQQGGHFYTGGRARSVILLIFVIFRFSRVKFVFFNSKTAMQKPIPAYT